VKLYRSVQCIFSDQSAGISSLDIPFNSLVTGEPISTLPLQSETYRTESPPAFDITNDLGDSTIASIATSAEITGLRNYITGMPLVLKI